MSHKTIHIFESLLKFYIDGIADAKIFTYHSMELSSEFLFGGLCFFMGSMILVTHEIKCENDIVFDENSSSDRQFSASEILQRSLDYTILYLYCDHYIDSSNIKPKQKELFISELKKIIESDQNIAVKDSVENDSLPKVFSSTEGTSNGEGMAFNSEKRTVNREERASDDRGRTSNNKENLASNMILPTILSRYYGLAHNNHMRLALKEMFNVMMTSYAIQYDSSLSYDDYFKISWDKGGITITTMYILISGKSLEIKGSKYCELYHLGGCIQCLDDIIDTSEDNRNNIMTASVYQLKNTGVLDQFAKNLLHNLTLLPDHYVNIRKFLMFILRYVIIRSKNFSKRFKQQTRATLMRYGIEYIRLENFRKRFENFLRNRLFSPS